MEKRSSRLATGCVTLFGVPFAAIGVGTGIMAIRMFLEGTEPAQTRWMLVAFSLTFLLAGLGVMALGIFGGRKLRRHEDLKSAQPEAPWAWREEWRGGRIPHRAGAAVVALWAFTIIWNLISAPMLFLLPPEIQKGNKPAMIGFLFPIVGAFLLWAAIHQTMRLRRYGVSTLVLPRVPIQPGETLSANLETNIDREKFGNAPFTVKVSCIRKITSGTGKSRSSREEVQWQEVEKISNVMPGMQGLTIPISFPLPSEFPESSPESSDDMVLWRVDVSAEVPGVDYEANFEIPVFRSGDAPLIRST